MQSVYNLPIESGCRGPYKEEPPEPQAILRCIHSAHFLMDRVVLHFLMDRVVVAQLIFSRTSTETSFWSIFSAHVADTF